MNEFDKKYKGKTFSFYELINTHNIEIPIIQRDYAQGREDKKEIRDNFLNALYNSLEGNYQLKLDFIYGSIVNDAFQPLDGQQRLTTLFLLHWYAATKDKCLDYNVQKTLNRFSYETRISSRDFCKSIINNRIIINKDNSISNIIIDSPWFYLSWKKDPTIRAMLRTIDDIHNKFCLIDNLWKKLISATLPICFYYVELENIGLTDDLYIKMNARGKLLSTFEKFKAGFQKYINSNKWEESHNPTDTFAFKIDTKWSDLFWANFSNKQSIDDSLVHFISTIAMIRHAIEKKEERINHITRLNDNPDSIRPELFSKDSFCYLKKCFDLYCNILESNIDLNLNLPLWRHKPSKDFLSQIVSENENISYTQKVLFYAQTEFLMYNYQNFKKEKFEDWMRVIRNIVSRGNIEVTGKRPDIIRSPQTFDGVINLISELSEGCSDIYNYLSKVEKINSSFARSQVEEEKLKAKLLMYNKENIALKNIIFEVEDNDLLMGRIEFALSCINFDYSEISSFDIEKFNKVGQVINRYFSKETDISNDIRRALLTIGVNGKYEYYEYWWSFWYVGNANKRCLIDKFRELEYYIYSDCKLYFKELVLKLIDNSLRDIIENFVPPHNMPNWKIQLIKTPALLDKNTSHYIAIPEDNSYCYLLKSKRPRDIDGSIKIK
ncbi:DUF262 domain-containing protein [Bacteroides xylanisolvens]|uniref:DUF262 domain-containing protein n=1 Tax=Bacteroides xylanisolvens TaxID=371601 RepID=UPI003515FB5E